MKKILVIPLLPAPPPPLFLSRQRNRESKKIERLRNDEGNQNCEKD